MAVFAPFTRLITNVKEAEELTLGPCTLIVGPNASYKTAIVDSIRLALTGKHPVGPYPSDVLELAADRAAGISISLQSADLFAEYDLRVVEGKAKEPTWQLLPKDAAKRELLTPENIERILPPTSVHELLSASHQRSREAVLLRFGPKGRGVPSPLGLDAEADKPRLALWHEAVIAAQDEIGRDATASAVLAGVQSWLRVCADQQGRAATKLRKEVDAAKRALTEEGASAENLTRLREAQKRAAAWERSQADRARLTTLKAEVDTARTRQQAAEAELARFTTTAEETTARLAAERAMTTTRLVELRQWLREQELRMYYGGRVVGALASATDGVCPFCLTASPNIPSQHEYFSAGVAARDAEIKKTQREIASEEEREAQQAVEAARHTAATATKRAEIEAVVRAAHTVITANEARIQEIEGRLAAPYTGPTSAELDATIKRLQDSLSARQNLTAQIATLNELERRQADAKYLHNEARLLGEKMLSEAATAAAEAITRYMPEGLQCVAQYDDTHWRWCSRSMKTGRLYREHGASGSEYRAVKLAFPIAWTEGAPLRVAIYDDVDLGPYDTGRLVSFLSKLKGAVDAGLLTQVFVVWNRAQEFRAAPPAGWTIIERGPRTPTTPTFTIV